ncbi:hypothetical protein V7079_27235 [Priestia megaterium]|uniref:hypothetical protein n=1 Tax=Priestia megaterium TaxID=1404 RepID=UPI000BF446E8|nr:hypothetical protein [Priestia megaterium]PFK01958.1 hypothetical protein COI96_06075 [Priestia megaterium]PMD08175.1 hypothetical protein CJ194_19455 [Priestia megaterium]
MSDMITTISAKSEKELLQKMEQLKNQHLALNPNRLVKVAIISPEKEKIEYKDYEATSVTVGLSIEEPEDDEE